MGNAITPVILERAILKFGRIMKIELVVRSTQTELRTIQIKGFTRNSLINIKRNVSALGNATRTTHAIDDIPIFISVVRPNFTNIHGDLFVSVSLLLNGEVEIPLVAGLATRHKPLSWPAMDFEDLIPGRGFFTVISPSDPSAGNNFSQTVPTNRIWHVHSISFKLVTDSNAATRTMFLRYSDGTNIQQFIVPTNTQIASLTRDYFFQKTGSVDVTISGERIFSQFPLDVWLKAGDELISFIENIQAGDQLSAIRIQIEQFFEGA